MPKTEDERRAMLKNKAVDLFKQQIALGLGYKKAKQAAIEVAEQKKKEFDENFVVDDNVEISERAWTIRMNQFDAIIKFIKDL